MGHVAPFFGAIVAERISSALDDAEAFWCSEFLATVLNHG
jgi:hypothetical protein